MTCVAAEAQSSEREVRVHIHGGTRRPSGCPQPEAGIKLLEVSASRQLKPCSTQASVITGLSTL